MFTAEIFSLNCCVSLEANGDSLEAKLVHAQGRSRVNEDFIPSPLVAEEIEHHPQSCSCFVRLL